jgi:hypothetical protein
MTSSGWLVLAVAYLALHFAAYVLTLRERAAFRHEAVIFGYHFWSAVALTTVSCVSWALKPTFEQAAAVVAAVALHGIYSTSFLELWSLSEGGYSLRILRMLEDARPAGLELDRGALQAIGARKKGNRISGLLRLGLARRTWDQLELTSFGRGVGAVLSSIAWLANLRELG